MYFIQRVLLQWGLVLGLLITGCRGEEPKRMPDTIPDITGMITQLQEHEEDTKDEIQLLVETQEDDGANTLSASVIINKHTLIETKDGARIKAGQLKPGLLVEVWYREKIMETMPAQAEAKALRVLTKTINKD
jgi:hypothetical protein